MLISGSKYQLEYLNNVNTLNSLIKTLQVDSGSGGALENYGYFKAGVAGLFIDNCS